MNRRSWVKSMTAGLAAFVGVGTAKAIPCEIQGRPKSERAANGDCLADAYRRCNDGEYRKVRREDLKAGDEFIMLGLDGDRLWKVHAFRVGKGGYFFRRLDGQHTVHIDGDACPVMLPLPFGRTTLTANKDSADAERFPGEKELARRCNAFLRAKDMDEIRRLRQEFGMERAD